MPAMQMDMPATKVKHRELRSQDLGCLGFTLLRFHFIFRVAVRCRKKEMGWDTLQRAWSPDEGYWAYDPDSQRNRIKLYVPVPAMRKKASVPEEMAIVETK